MKSLPEAPSRCRQSITFAVVLTMLLFLCLVQTRPLRAVDATADPLSLGAHTSYTNTSCDDYSCPTVSGYYIGDSETPWHNAPVKRASAMMWLNQGYATGNALSTWWTGGGYWRFQNLGPDTSLRCDSVHQVLQVTNDSRNITSQYKFTS